jgi:LacI family transcriptional regulator
MKTNAGDERATIRDVAKAANVSLSTASRVVNRDETVRAELRQRVLKAVDSLSYEPDAAAQSLRRQSTKMVGCLVSNIAYPPFSATVGAAEERLYAASYTMLLMASHGRVEREIDILARLRRRRLDSLIATVSSEHDLRVQEELVRLKIPIVLLERQLPLPFDTVCNDHFGGAYEATRYLLTLGHRRIGLITTSAAILPGRERRRAFAQAHAESGLEIDPGLVAGPGHTRDNAYRTACEFLNADDRPSAILAGAHQMVGVLRAARAARLRIPDDLSLICFGETDLTELMTPPLTVVRWDSGRVGQVAAEILLSRLDGTARPSPLSIMLPCDLVLRASCAPLTRETAS